MSELRVDSVKSKGGGAPDLPKGVTISGITTAVTLGATQIDGSNVNVSGVVTSGTLSGSLLSTGTPTLGLGVTINSSGLVISGVATAGIVSATTLYGDGSNLSGVGATIAPLFYNPDQNDRTVTVGTGIGITFNQQIKAGSGNINLRLVSIGGTIVEAFGVGSSVTISENRLSFDPASDLDQNTIYCVDIPGTALTNNEGTAYVGTAFTFQSSYSFNQLWMWGSNEYGQLGQNQGPAQIDAISSPVQIPGLNWSKIHNEGFEYMGWGALKSDGTRWMWGKNQYGTFGDNSLVDKSSPVQIPGTDWSSTFALGGTATFWIKTDGTLWVHGYYNGDGNLGQNNRIQYSSPVQIPGTNWKKAIPLIYNAVGTKTDGTLWTWGYNGAGALGLNQAQTPGPSSPTQVPGTTWTGDLSGNTYNVASIKSDGTLWLWGSNSSGQLGQNNRTQHSSPVQVPGTTWRSLYTGDSSQFATKTDGTLWAWGQGSKGQLGQNSEVKYSSPVQIPGATWSTNGAAVFHALNIKTDGTLWGWGDNAQGQLGHNDVNHRSSPVQIGSDTTWTQTTLEWKASGGIKTIEG